MQTQSLIQTKSHFPKVAVSSVGTHAAEVQEDVNFGCNAAPARFPNQIGASSTEYIPTKSNDTIDAPNKKGMVKPKTLLTCPLSDYLL